jgi:hypothetical protein
VVRLVGSSSACRPCGLAFYRAVCRPVTRLGCGSKEARTQSTRIRSAHLGQPSTREGIVMTMIGIDPHKATHTAVAIDDDEVVLDEFRLNGCWGGRRVSRNDSGLSSLPTGSVTLSLSSWLRPVKLCSMCHRYWRRGFGCWDQEGLRRTTRMMPGRWQ